MYIVRTTSMLFERFVFVVQCTKSHTKNVHCTLNHWQDGYNLVHCTKLSVILEYFCTMYILFCTFQNCFWYVQSEICVQQKLYILVYFGSISCTMYSFWHFDDMIFVHCTELPCTFLIGVVWVTMSVFGTYWRVWGCTIFIEFCKHICKGCVPAELLHLWLPVVVKQITGNLKCCGPTCSCQAVHTFIRPKYNVSFVLARIRQSVQQVGLTQDLIHLRSPPYTPTGSAHCPCGWSPRSEHSTVRTMYFTLFVLLFKLNPFWAKSGAAVVRLVRPCFAKRTGSRWTSRTPSLLEHWASRHAPSRGLPQVLGRGQVQEGAPLTGLLTTRAQDSLFD